MILMIACAWLYSCGDDNMNGPRGSTEVPLQVTNTSVRNFSGASAIYYDLPDDKNLKYVKAVWTTDDSIEYSQTASFYTDSIVVDGFGAEGTYSVQLYSVSTGDTYSEPVSVTVQPARPPYLVAYDRMEILPNFMGIRVVSENETGAKLTFRTFKKDTLINEYVEVGTDYVLNPRVEYYNRGHAADTLQHFAVQIRDRWGHWSPRMEVSVIPWFEMELPKSKFMEIALCNLADPDTENNPPSQTDQQLPSNYWGHKMHSWNGSNVAFSRLWDNRIEWEGSLMSNSYIYHNKPLAPLPSHFTIDLGAQYNLSRMKLWPRNDAINMFKGGHPQIVRVFGASYNGEGPGGLVDDINDPSAWIDLGIFYISRADGLFDPYPGNSDRTVEDNNLMKAGHEMILKSVDQKIRYVRVQTLKCFSVNTATQAVMISEIAFFGSDK